MPHQIPSIIAPRRLHLFGTGMLYPIIFSVVMICATTLSPKSPADEPSLANFHAVSDSVLSGGHPTTESDFRHLARQGVTAIISVDGVRPDIEAAKRHSIRYIHIPVGYDGLDQHAKLSCIQVADLADEKIYVHCHHGTHRGPTAATIIAMARDEIDHAAAMDFLAKVGTDRRYTGLWSSVSTFDRSQTKGKAPKLVAHVPATTLVDTMTKLDRLVGRIERFTKQDDPDAIKSGAIQIQQLYTELLRTRTDQSKRGGDLEQPTNVKDFEQLTKAFRGAENHARVFAKAANTGIDLTKHLEKLKQNCTKCHAKHRNH